MRTAPRRSTRICGSIAIVALSAAACGGSDGSADPVADTGDSVSVDARADDTAGANDTEVGGPGYVDLETIEGARPGEVAKLVERLSIDTLVHYAGFDIEVVDVLIGFDPAGFSVAQVDVELLNTTPSRDRLGTAVEIESGGVVVGIDRDLTTEVDPGSRALGAFSLRLDASFDVSDAVLWIGRPDRNRVRIPLNESGELVTREPTVLTGVATVESEIATIRLDTVTVGWDRADPRAQSDPGDAFLTIDYDLTSSVATAISSEVWMLTTPAGTSTEPVDGSILQVEPGVPTGAQEVTFLVADPAAGDYVLTYSDRFGKGDAEVTFTVP